MTDHDLIRDFTATRSELAFRRLVDRHCDLVFSVAARVTRDPDLARDVAQQVFCKLAAKPKSVSPGLPLAAWLHRSTHSLAVDLVRSEAARRRREQSFSPAMNPHPEPAPAPAPDWSRLEPVIDSLIDELPELERRAVVLRFYEKKSHGAIGSLLGLSEEATRKRLDRALEKLRARLAKRGIATSSAALATILPAYATAPAPAGLSASLSSTALSTAAATTAAAGTASTSILAIAMSHKTVSAAAALLLLAGVTAIAVPKLTKDRDKDKNAPPPASASAPATTGNATTGADPGGAAARGKSKANPATARLTEKYGDSRTKLAGHLSTEVIAMLEDLLIVMDFTARADFGGETFHDPAEALGDAAEHITLSKEQEARIVELQAASSKREADEVRTHLAELKKEPETLVEMILLSDALKRGEITQAEFDAAAKRLDFSEGDLDFAMNGGDSDDDTADDPVFVAEVLRVLDEAQGKAYQDALAARKSAKAADVAAAEKRIMTLEEFEKQVTSTRKIVRGAAQMMEGISDGGLMVPE